MWMTTGVRRLGYGSVALGAGLLGAALLAPELARQRLERHVSMVVGRHVRVTSAALRWKALTARGVVVAGGAPCAAEPLARAATIRFTFAESAPWRWRRPTEIGVEGLAVNACGAAGKSNLPERRAAADRVRGSGPVPLVRISGIDLRTSYVTNSGRAVGFRATSGAAEMRGGRLHARFARVSFDLYGALTFEASDAIVERERDGAMRATATDGALLVPGGGVLLRGFQVEGTGRADATGAVAARHLAGPDLVVRLARDHLGVRLDLNVDALALAPLRPLLDRNGIDLSDARGALRGEAHLPVASSRVSFKLAGAAEGITLRHPALDRRPWTGLSGRAEMEGSVDWAGGRLELRAAPLELLGLPLELRGSVSWTDGLRAALALRTPEGRPARCAPLLEAQAPPLRDVLRGLTLDGALGLRAALELDAKRWDDLTLEMDLDPLCVVVREPAVLERWLPGTHSGSLTATGVALSDGRASDSFLPLSRLPKILLDAFVTAEDGRFWQHRGFDPETIRRALAHDLAAGAFAKGASTITQQLAKNLFLSRERSLGRKLAEATLAWRLEQRLGKRRILELYLNIIELGPGLYGVSDAARSYFGKPATELTTLEAVHLAALTPNPRGFARRFRSGRVDEPWLQRLHELLLLMQRSGRLTAAQVSAARASPLVLRKQKF